MAKKDESIPEGGIPGFFKSELYKEIQNVIIDNANTDLTICLNDENQLEHTVKELTELFNKRLKIMGEKRNSLSTEGINYNIPEDSENENPRDSDGQFDYLIKTIKDYSDKINTNEIRLAEIQNFKEEIKDRAALMSGNYARIVLDKTDIVYMLNKLGEQYQVEINKYYKLIDDAIRHHYVVKD